MKRILASLSLALLAAIILPALAAAQPGRFELTPYGGYRLAGDFNAPRNDSTFGHLNAKVGESAVFGVTFGIPLSRNLRLELLANRQRSEFRIDDGLLSRSTKLGDVDLTMVHAGFAVEWGEGQVKPFLVASGGVTRIDPKFNELEADTRVSGSLGGGVKVLFSDNVGLRFEVRGYWTDLNAHFRDNDRHNDSNDGLYQAEGSTGLIIRF